MLEKQKILVTGPAGNIGFPLARELAKHNDVWGISRFGNPAERKKVEDAGITTRAIDLAEGEFGDLPHDFDYVLHIGALISGTDFDRAIKCECRGHRVINGPLPGDQRLPVDELHRRLQTQPRSHGTLS